MGSGAKNTWLEGAVTRLGFVLLWLNTQLPWSCQSLNARLLGCSSTTWLRCAGMWRW